MNTDRAYVGNLPIRNTHHSQLPAEVVLQPPHNSPHHRILQPLKSALHHHPAHSSQLPMRKMEHIHYPPPPPPPPPVGHPQIPAVVRPAVVQSVSTIILIGYLTNGIPKRIRRPITVPTRLADPQKPRIAKPKSRNSSKSAPAIHTQRPSIIKNDTSRPHTPVIPPQPPVYPHVKGEATILHLDPPATRYPLPTPVVPTVIHTPSHGPVAPPPQNIQRKRWRHNYLEAYKASLDAEAENHFVREQVAPLNPVLSAPPIPFRYHGTLRGKLLLLFSGMEMFHGVVEDMNPLPQIAWDVRCAPSTLVITARPYPFSDPTLTKKQMKRRALLDHNEVLRLYGQASTNPPYVLSYLYLSILFRNFKESDILFSRCTVGQTMS